MTDRYKFTLIIERITWVVVHPLCMPPMHSGHLINSHNLKPENVMLEKRIGSYE